MDSVTDCFHSNQPSLSSLSSRRNLSATKLGDLRDKIPSLSARATFFPYPLLPPTQNTFRSLCNEESEESERGSDSFLLVNSIFLASPILLADSFLLRIRILVFVPE
ncbi:hypothetical protein AVEN_76293-1 [Araneus ventricosus]|uniref:Uncharacterized protein n=1 Tax=Araneus ventricosus TaxID=182803 RepID=A0A4Y2SH06_ARAVE|nr:hypothetical protein AVEN_158020-1 [Araneus ventricosus]GBN87063.1 hypothetical protein AVEN_76293-1 [Araneus ventricosus]